LLIPLLFLLVTAYARFLLLEQASFAFFAFLDVFGIAASFSFSWTLLLYKGVQPAAEHGYATVYCMEIGSPRLHVLCFRGFCVVDCRYLEVTLWGTFFCFFVLNAIKTPG
jgi:hypothetical protein